MINVMASHETTARTDEWYTPPWIFEGLNVKFDLDPCNSKAGQPANDWCAERFPMHGLEKDWFGRVWLNPPFGGRNGIRPWLERLVDHGNGIALVPNRTATGWFQDAADAADRVMFLRGKVKFIDAWGQIGRSPGYGNVLLAYGSAMRTALLNADIDGFLAR
jgi:hypothetical protein